MKLFIAVEKFTQKWPENGKIVPSHGTSLARYDLNFLKEYYPSELYYYFELKKIEESAA